MADHNSDRKNANLKAHYDSLIEQASVAHKHGQIKDYAKLTREADAILRQIEDVEIEQGHS